MYVCAYIHTSYISMKKHVYHIYLLGGLNEIVWVGCSWSVFFLLNSETCADPSIDYIVNYHFRQCFVAVITNEYQMSASSWVQVAVCSTLSSVAWMAELNPKRKHKRRKWMNATIFLYTQPTAQEPNQPKVSKIWFHTNESII